jgi:phage terminase large subunit-like protein
VTDAVTKAQQKMIDTGQPYRVYQPVRRKDHEGNLYTINKALLEEYLVYPFASHDDFLDACSRIYDIDARPPVLIDARELEPVEYVDGS